MNSWIEERENKLRAFFALDSGVELIDRETVNSFEITPQIAEHLARFNIEWHIIPSEQALHIGTEDYHRRLYPMLRLEKSLHDHRKTSSYRAVLNGHRRHQGRIVGVETTQKPRYLPGNRQQYGTQYGFDDRADPFAEYLGRANFASGTRYDHNYTSLNNFVNLVTKDWRVRGLMPKGYRLTICPPVIFNLIGNVFHPEWSQTETLELGFYRDEHGNAQCYGVGSNAPGDFSFIRSVEGESAWALLGFRTALVPE